MRRFFVMVMLFVFTLDVFAQALPVSSMQNAVSGVIQAKMRARGFAANDPRWGATLQGGGATIVGAAAAAAVVTLAGVTAPAWVTAGVAVGLSTLFAYGINLAIDGTVHWLMSSDGTVTTAGSSGDASGAGLVAGGPFFTGPNGNQYADAGLGSAADAWAQSCARYNDTRCGADTFEIVNDYRPAGGVVYNVMRMSSWPFGLVSNFGMSFSSSGASATCSAGQTSINGTCSAFLVAASASASAPAPAANLSIAAAAIAPTDAAKPLNPAIIAALANSALQQAAAQPGYSGLPVDVTDPITATDAATWQAANPDHWPTVGEALAPQPAPAGGTAASPFQLPNSPPVSSADPATNTTPQTNPATGDQVNLGSDPGIGAPTLEVTPTSESILAPLLNLMPDLRTFAMPSHAGECPHGTFTVWGNDFVMDGHCTLAEQLRTPIYYSMMVFWALAALLIILAA